MYAGNCRLNKMDSFDYYATEPKAVVLLLEQETFTHTVWEPACGEGHIAKVLASHGYQVVASDIVDRGFGIVKDFMEHQDSISIDIITNPPYNKAQEFVEHALNIATDGVKIAMFLKLTFLEGKKRRNLFDKHPPRKVYIYHHPGSGAERMVNLTVKMPWRMLGLYGKKDTKAKQQ